MKPESTAMVYKGLIIEESLETKEVLKKLWIISTKIEPVTEVHKTPWIKQWTMHTVEISEKHIKEIADQIAGSIDGEHTWYADFKNDLKHYIVFKNKVFTIDRSNTDHYDEVKKYGISIGIPEHQLDFKP